MCIQQTITNLGGGLELRKPDGHHEGQEGGGRASRGAAAAKDPEVVSHYVELLEEWCSKIRVYLKERYQVSLRYKDTFSCVYIL